MNDYLATSDLIDAIARALDYHPKDGFDLFYLHAADQRSATPSVELAERHFPGVPIDHAKLEAADGFGALVDCTHANQRLGWAPKFRCIR